MNENKDYRVDDEDINETEDFNYESFDEVTIKKSYNGRFIKIKKLSKRIHEYLNELPTIKYIFIMSAASFLIALILVPLQLLFPAPNNFHKIIPDWSDYLNIFFIVVLLQPFSETITCQFIPLTILKNIKWIKKYNGLHIFISALYFGIGHYDFGGIGKVILAFFIGIILAYSYVLYSDKKKKPILIVFVIHAIHNFMVTFGLSMFIMLFQNIFK